MSGSGGHSARLAHPDLRRPVFTITLASLTIGQWLTAGLSRWIYILLPADAGEGSVMKDVLDGWEIVADGVHANTTSPGQKFHFVRCTISYRGEIFRCCIREADGSNQGKTYEYVADNAVSARGADAEAAVAKAKAKASEAGFDKRKLVLAVSEAVDGLDD